MRSIASLLVISWVSLLHTRNWEEWILANHFILTCSRWRSVSFFSDLSLLKWIKSLNSSKYFPNKTSSHKLIFSPWFTILRNLETTFFIMIFSILQDCERRAIAKLFRHRSDEKRSTLHQEATEWNTPNLSFARWPCLYINFCYTQIGSLMVVCVLMPPNILP